MFSEPLEIPSIFRSGWKGQLEICPPIQIEASQQNSNLFQINLNKYRLFIKVVCLEEACNFAVDNFLIWKHVVPPKKFISFLDFDVQIWIFQRTFDGEMTQIEVVVLDEI